ncbi:outer membrane beta-barrel protein [Nostoc sp. NIES-2111]
MFAAGGIMLAAGSANAQRIQSRDYQPMVWGDWLVTGNAGIGFLYSSNLYGSSRNVRAGYGTALTADLGAVRSDGIHTTSLFATALAGLYAGNAGANNYSGSIGLSHSWSIAPDLTWAANLGLAFGQNTLDAANAQNGAGGVYDKPQPYLTGTFGTTLTKELKDFIIDVGGSINSQFYGDQKTTTGDIVSTGSSDNGTNYQINTRVSYKLSPDLRLFVQPSYNWERYRQSINDNEGYTLTGGISFGGGDLLIGGDVYGVGKARHIPTRSRTERTARRPMVARSGGYPRAISG